MRRTNVTLSAKELNMTRDCNWLLTKNVIIGKTISLLERLQESQTDYLSKNENQIPAEVLRISPKISKGENYKGLPWLVLDYPRLFKKEDVFAIRTLFWWGNFFSVTLHISGKYRKLFEKNIRASFAEFKKLGFSVCINPGEWEHHFDKTNYRPLARLSRKSFSEIIMKSSFIKLSRKIPLQNWEKVYPLLMESFMKITESLRH